MRGGGSQGELQVEVAEMQATHDDWAKTRRLERWAERRLRIPVDAKASAFDSGPITGASWPIENRGGELAIGEFMESVSPRGGAP
jgi:hypothetical protein